MVLDLWGEHRIRRKSFAYQRSCRGGRLVCENNALQGRSRWATDTISVYRPLCKRFGGVTHFVALCYNLCLQIRFFQDFFWKNNKRCKFLKTDNLSNWRHLFWVSYCSTVLVWGLFISRELKVRGEKIKMIHGVAGNCVKVSTHPSFLPLRPPHLLPLGASGRT